MPDLETLRRLLAERILVFDGAMGTMIQGYGLSEADFRGQRFRDHERSLAGANDLLVLTQPGIVEEIHRRYFEAGADIVETNTFNATSVSLADYGLEPWTREINREAARIARKAAEAVMQVDRARPRFVAGAMGPTNTTASLSPDVNDAAFRKVRFQDLEGGVDVLLPETTFDTLNLKAALFAIERAFEVSGKSVPILASITIIGPSGRTLSGQTLEAFWNSIRHAPLFAVGINCALGVRDMRAHVEEWDRLSPLYTFCYPNAGLPNEMGGYDETPEMMAQALGEFAAEGWLNLVGGCCGTTPDHIAAIAEAVAGCPPRRPRKRAKGLRLSGLDAYVVTSETNFTVIGERTNVTGSRAFMRLIKAGQFEDAITIARHQVEGGANLLDVNVDEGLLDSESVMTRFLNQVASEPDVARIPVMVDSSKFSVIEAGLRCLQGKGVVNSISLKEGETEFLRQARLIRRYGAAVVVMAFDEQGQATAVDHKVAIAERAFRLLVEQAGFDAEDVIFDPNVLTVGTGIEEHDDYARTFLAAIPLIKERCPGARTSGGISNVSFAFRGNEPVRRAMNTAFLFHAIAAGLDMAIVNAGQLDVYEDLDPVLRERVEDVLLNRRPDATERLIAFGSTYAAKEKGPESTASWRESPLPDRVRHALMHGVADHVEADMLEALETYPTPLSIIEGPLMDGMNVVGELFGAGRMFLPQVVKSARVMKKAVAVLEPHMSREGQTSRGKVLMATVKGDVHDIGKNIVGVVLGCNGFKVIDLGVMVPSDRILAEAKATGADIIGLSGLITPSLDEMVHVAKEMERLGFSCPLLIGGATTSPKHTAVKIAPVYSGPTIHVHDASRSVPVVEKLTQPAARAAFVLEVATEQDAARSRYRSETDSVPLLSLERAREQGAGYGSVSAPVPEFVGVRDEHLTDLSVLIPYIDWAPFLATWEIRGRSRDWDGPRADPRVRELIDDARRLLERISSEGLLEARAVYGFFPVTREGDDVIVHTDERRLEQRAKLHFLRRQQVPRSGQRDGALCLADWIGGPGSRDHLGAFVVTTGLGADDLCARYASDHDDYGIIMTKAVADRLAEAYAEWMHRRMRQSWAIEPAGEPALDALFGGDYQGIRPAPGYPACPDHTEKGTLFDLLDAPARAGVQLTESYAMTPAASVSAFVLSHPASRYFSVGKLGRDQIVEYAHRKRVAVEEAERWLGSWLAYDPSAGR